MTRAVEIRPYVDDDWVHVWPIVHEVVTAADTYPYDPAWSQQQLRDIWVEPPPSHTVVAVADASIIGTAKMSTNKPGPGSHIATASFMVARQGRGHGTGRALGEYALEWAARTGYHGMQFNAVVEVNTAAVELWRSLGFRIVGTVPEAYRHPTAGLVGLHVMYREI